MAAPETGETEQFARIAGVLKQLNPGTGLMVWCNHRAVSEEVQAYLRAVHLEAEIRTTADVLPAAFRCLLLSPDQSSEAYSIWVRDAFLFKPGRSGGIEMAETTVPKFSDAGWAGQYLQHLRFDNGLDLTLDPGKVKAAGGNVLADCDFILVGARQFKMSYAGSDRKHASTQLLQTLAGGEKSGVQRVIEIGSFKVEEPRKLVHIDLYLSLTGCLTSREKRYIVLLARCIPAAGEPDLVPVAGRMNEYLDDVAEVLTQEGFHVLRNPVPLLRSKTERVSYLGALNNCLTEVCADGRTVWLSKLSNDYAQPGHRELLVQAEQDNADIWHKLGFDVRFVEGNFHATLDDDGGLHCITNEFWRTAPDALPHIDIP